MITGYTFGIIGAGLAYYGTTINPDIVKEVTIKSNKTERNACLIGGGALSLMGLGFELSGIGKIGRAGVSLNENGIGVKVKF